MHWTHLILLQVRVVVASRVATSGKEWHDLFYRYNSGTYNNQWMAGHLRCDQEHWRYSTAHQPEDH